MRKNTMEESDAQDVEAILKYFQDEKEREMYRHYVKSSVKQIRLVTEFLTTFRSVSHHILREEKTKEDHYLKEYRALTLACDLLGAPYRTKVSDAEYTVSFFRNWLDVATYELPDERKSADESTNEQQPQGD
jgi:hypothetical protein